MFEVGVQTSVTGLYRAELTQLEPSWPPQTIISLPVHTAVGLALAEGAPMVEVGIQTSVTGLYRAPELTESEPSWPPQTIISLPVHTAVWPDLSEGAPVVEVVRQEPTASVIK